MNILKWSIFFSFLLVQRVAFAILVQVTPDWISTPFDPPLMGEEKKETGGHPQTLGSILLHRHGEGFGQSL
jgi:hypothetical protein